MKRFAFAMFALSVGVVATPQVSDAQQMALKLPGNPLSYVAAPDKGFLDEEIGSEITIEAWVNPASNLGDENADPPRTVNEYIIVNKEDSYEISVRNNDVAAEGCFDAAIQDDDESWDWCYPETGVGTVPVGKWTHVAATYDGLVVRLYVNGKFTFERLWPPSGDKGVLRSTDASFKIGRRVRGNADYHSAFDGLIDEVRVSRGVRYTGDSFPVPTKEFVPDANTVALFHFNEVSTSSSDIAALKAKFEAAAVDQDPTKEEASTINIKGIVKDSSTFANHAGLIESAVLVASDAPITP